MAAPLGEPGAMPTVLVTCAQVAVRPRVPIWLSFYTVVHRDRFMATSTRQAGRTVVNRRTRTLA